MLFAWAFFISFITALLVTPAVRIAALHFGTIDTPGPRKIHQKPTPLLGGLAIYLAVSFSTILFLNLGYLTTATITATQISVIILGGAFLMFGGYLDDRYNLKPFQQFLFPAGAIALVLLSGISIKFITNPFGGVLFIPSIVGTVLTMLWMLGMSYTTKLLDGLDGLTTGITAIGSLLIFLVSLTWDVPQSGTSILALIVAGAAAGFLAYNWHPAYIFLGEGGSVFCGFMLGILAIISGSKIATALLIMGIPVLDVLWVIVRRVIQGKSPAQADRKHLHFRLLDIGLSHRQAVLTLYAVTAAFGASSLFLQSFGKVIALLILAAFMFVLASGLILVYNLKNKPHN